MYSCFQAVKLGCGLASDLKTLRASYPSMHAFGHAERLLDLKGPWLAFARLHNLPAGRGGSKNAVGLSTIAGSILGKPLNKAMQAGLCPVCQAGPTRSCCCSVRLRLKQQLAHTHKPSSTKGPPSCLQCSDWETRPLSPKQLHYAALDAHVAVQVHRHLSSGPGCLLPQQLQAFTFAWPEGPPGRPAAGRRNGPSASDVSRDQAGSGATPTGSGTGPRAGGASDTSPGAPAGSREQMLAGHGSASRLPAAEAAAGTGQALSSTFGRPGSGAAKTGGSPADAVSSGVPQQDESGGMGPTAAGLGTGVAASSNGSSSRGTAPAGLPVEGTLDTDSDNDDGGSGGAPAVASPAAGGTASAASAEADAADAAASVSAAGNAEMGASGAASQAELLSTCATRQLGAAAAHPAGLDGQAGSAMAQGQSSLGALQPANATAGPAPQSGSGCSSGVSGVEATDGTAGGLARVRACLAQHNLSAAFRCLPLGTGEGLPSCLMHWTA